MNGLGENPFRNKGDKRFLVMARVGDNSLHKEWLQPNEYKIFDLYLEYYGDGSNDYRGDCDFYTEAKDSKWPRFYKIMEQWGESILKYDAIWMPDDDIRTNCSAINKMFHIFMSHNLALAQPALTRDSYYSHGITLENYGYTLRYTNWVEVMVPIFSREALQLLWPTFNKSISGWGLDSIWPKILGYPKDRIAVIDKVPVTHTRPVGGGTIYKDIGAVDPYQELQRLCQEYDVVTPFDTNIYGTVMLSEKKRNKYKNFFFSDHDGRLP
ncbi:DUF707 domain-containing protein [Alkalihalobacillus deserti]|uniref:DUF707 domain-containing protein n=1 Tax=Alkalihalobacillus deserti TaxID=2879466 RepID=UPI001D15D130|nr:DUF707 domain-containing protein [Alkalihalobacillus deserti]